MKIDYDNKVFWLEPEDDVDERRLKNLQGKLSVLNILTNDGKIVQMTLKEE